MSSCDHSKPGSDHASPTFRAALLFWLKLGFISFGGPAGQIAIMHRELVERRRWVTEEHFLNGLNFCMLLPGPEAQQLATYLGWLLHRTWGGVIAGSLFVLPSAVLLYGLSWAYVTYGNIPWVSSLFYGLKPAILALVVCALVRIGQKVLRNSLMWFVAGLAFVGLFFFNAPFPVVILLAGVLGFMGGFWRPKNFAVPSDPQLKTQPASARPPFHAVTRAVRVLAICLVLWWAPVAVLWFWLGPSHTLVREALFFSKASLVTFGGAYAVLPYVSQQAVETHQWLSAAQMLDGLGLAETTPGPLIIVLQFVGFLGAWNQPGGMPPLAAASLGAAITTWTTFVPSFLFIFLGAPYIERVRGVRSLSAALSTITAAVVGVILNLAVWFGMKIIFPLGERWDPWMLAVSVGAAAALLRWKGGTVPVLAGCALLGVLWRYLFTG